MKILVIGGTGNVGSQVVAGLLKRKADVRVMTSSIEKVGRLPAGTEVVYAGDELNKWAERAKTMLPEWLVSDFRIMYQHFQRKGLIASPEQIAETERILGRKPRSFDSFVAEITKAWKQEKMVAATMRMTS